MQFQCLAHDAYLIIMHCTTMLIISNLIPMHYVLYYTSMQTISNVIGMHCATMLIMSNLSPCSLLCCTTILIISNVIPIHCTTKVIISNAIEMHCTTKLIISNLIPMHCLLYCTTKLIVSNAIVLHFTMLYNYNALHNYAYHKQFNSMNAYCIAQLCLP